MNWFYAENGVQRGPIEDSQFDQLAASGAIKPSTLVWCEGMAGWKPYAEARPVAGAAPTTAGVICAGCGGSFSVDEVVRVEGRFVCANCKPAILQQMLEGVAPSGSGSRGTVSEADLLQRDYSVDIGGCLGRSWETFKADPWTIIGVSILAYIAMVAGGIIPILGPILQFAVQGAILGGVWLFYIKKARGQVAGVGDAFSGFGPRFGPLFLASFIPTVITLLVVAVAAIPFVFGFIATAASTGRGGAGPEISAAVIAGLVIGGLVLAFLILVVTLMWFFALPLVIDKGYGFWSAMELSRKTVFKRFWSTVLMVIVAWLLMAAGMMACLVGVLVTGPVVFGMFAEHYKCVFDDLTPQS
jgi:hypothetical protein